MSSTPHSSASHHNAAVLVELRSTTGINFLIRLPRATKSLQLPSPSASSVMTSVPLCADSSKPEAALMLRAHCTAMPRALNSFSMPGFGPLLATMMTALVLCSRGIKATVARLQASAAQFRIAVSYCFALMRAKTSQSGPQMDFNRSLRRHVHAASVTKALPVLAPEQSCALVEQKRNLRALKIA